MHISYADLDTCMFDGKQISIQNSPTINAQVLIISIQVVLMPFGIQNPYLYYVKCFMLHCSRSIIETFYF